jgi:hypothetical protein
MTLSCVSLAGGTDFNNLNSFRVVFNAFDITGVEHVGSFTENYLDINRQKLILEKIHYGFNSDVQVSKQIIEFM